MRSYFDKTPRNVYASSINALAGPQDDAGFEGFSREGLEQLGAPLRSFEAEFLERHGREES